MANAGFDSPDARLMIASAFEDLAQALLEVGKPLPVSSDHAHSPEADLVEQVPLLLDLPIPPKLGVRGSNAQSHKIPNGDDRSAADGDKPQQVIVFAHDVVRVSRDGALHNAIVVRICIHDAECLVRRNTVRDRQELGTRVL